MHLYLHFCLYFCMYFCLYFCLYVHPQTFLGLRRLQRVGQCCLLGLWQAQPGSTGRRVPRGELPKHTKIPKFGTRGDLWHWLVCPVKSQKYTDQCILERHISLKSDFFGHPAFALAPYKCDYFTSFTQGTDVPPSPTVETFFDLENPTTPSPFTIFSKISSYLPLIDIENRIGYTLDSCSM